MGLAEYKKKRRFSKTPEPGPQEKTSELGNIFVVQKHRATQLHYDFRLEADGVLKSWAVPKGPPMDPAVKRLAMQVEDHPVDYAEFEGVIPEGEYGGGTVMVWDIGVYAPENTDNVSRALAKGELKFVLLGKKLKGSFVLVRTRERQWLLMKHKDEYAKEGEDITETQPYSVLTKRTLVEIAEDEGGDMKKAATGDPKKLPRRTGFEVLEWLRSQSAALSRIPVVMLTSSRHSVDVNRAYDLRANGYLTKPDTAQKLQEMLLDFKRYWLRWNEAPELRAGSDPWMT